MEELKQKFQLLTDICRYFEHSLINSAYQAMLQQFHHPNYINGKINKKDSKTWINKLAESLLQSSCYKKSYTVSHKPQLFLLHSYQEIHLHQTQDWKPWCLWTFVTLFVETPCQLVLQWLEREKEGFIIFVNMQIGSWDPGHKDQMLVSLNSYVNRIQ